MNRGAWQAAVHRIPQSGTQWKQLDSGSICTHMEDSFCCTVKLTQHCKATIHQQIFPFFFKETLYLISAPAKLEFKQLILFICYSSWSSLAANFIRFQRSRDHFFPFLFCPCIWPFLPLSNDLSFQTWPQYFLIILA